MSGAHWYIRVRTREKLSRGVLMRGVRRRAWSVRVVRRKGVTAAAALLVPLALGVSPALANVAVHGVS